MLSSRFFFYLFTLEVLFVNGRKHKLKSKSRDEPERIDNAKLMENPKESSDYAAMMAHEIAKTLKSDIASCGDFSLSRSESFQFLEYSKWNWEMKKKIHFAQTKKQGDLKIYSDRRLMGIEGHIYFQV